MNKRSVCLLIVVITVIVVCAGVSFGAFSYAMKAETYARYMGLQNILAEKLFKTVHGMETNARNVFDEVGKNMDSPEAVINALKSKTSLAPDVRGYFAAFEPNYFKEKGTWFEPYVHHHGNSEFVLTMVGSARHDYTKSEWYVCAKESKSAFWSDPYYYYDGTEISGHYCTFVEPIYDATGQLACVCGADITLDWLTEELQRTDEEYRSSDLLNKYRMKRELNFFSVVLTEDGSSIIYPENKKITVKDDEVLRDMAHKRSGTIDMTVDGVPSTLYYGPIEGIDWTLVVVAPQCAIEKPLWMVGIGLLLVALIGIIVAVIIIRRAQ